MISTNGSGCGDEGGHIFSVKATLIVVKATGKLAKAKGTLRLTGVYSRDDGTFSVKLTGTLKKSDRRNHERTFTFLAVALAAAATITASATAADPLLPFPSPKVGAGVHRRAHGHDATAR